MTAKPRHHEWKQQSQQPRQYPPQQREPQQSQLLRPAQPSIHAQSPRKSLKQSLKDLFLRRPKKPVSPYIETVGSGILRRAGPSTSFLPSASSIFSFPDASTNSQLTVDTYPGSRGIPNRFESQIQSLCPRPGGRKSLLPATSLSQLNLRHAYLQRSSVHHRAVHDAISPASVSITSWEASIASLTSIPSVSSASTLRLQESRPSLVDRSSSRHLTRQGREASPPKTSGPGKKQVSWLQSPTASSVFSGAGTTPTRHDRMDRAESTGDLLVEHFRSFCILDTLVPGCPVVSTSKELRYIFEIGEQFFLNSYECEGTSMDIVTGQDAAGDPVTHLVLFTPLVIPSSGRSRFILASLIDVTRFIHDAAYLPVPELEKTSTCSASESDPPTPLPKLLHSDWSLANKLSAEDLLGGCFLRGDRASPAKVNEHPLRDDVWLHLAQEERNRPTSTNATPRSTPKFQPMPRCADGTHSPKAGSTVDEVLDDFMSGLQELYSDFFLLGKSPLDDTYYEICNVSPTLYATKDYIHGHLSHTGPEGLAELSTRLTQGAPFDLAVKWGLHGSSKTLYCIPLYGQNTVTWVCFLVDDEVPRLW